MFRHEPRNGRQDTTSNVSEAQIVTLMADVARDHGFEAVESDKVAGAYVMGVIAATYSAGESRFDDPKRTCGPSVIGKFVIRAGGDIEAGAQAQQMIDAFYFGLKHRTEAPFARVTGHFLTDPTGERRNGWGKIRDWTT